MTYKLLLRHNVAPGYYPDGFGWMLRTKQGKPRQHRWPHNVYTGDVVGLEMKPNDE